MLNKVLAVFALATLIVYVGILLVFVRSPSLIIVVTIGVSFASFDVFNAMFRNKNGKS